MIKKARNAPSRASTTLIEMHSDGTLRGHIFFEQPGGLIERPFRALKKCYSLQAETHPAKIFAFIRGN
jgi:hypothetical protein